MLVKYTFLNTGIDVAKFRMHVHLPSYGTFLSFEKFVKRYNSSPMWTFMGYIRFLWLAHWELGKIPIPLDVVYLLSNTANDQTDLMFHENQ